MLHNEFENLEKEGEIQLQVHERITNLREFTETFLYYFS